MFSKDARTTRGLVIASTIGAAALTLVPASADAAKVRFGAKLDSTTQPSNAGPAHYCDDNDHSVSCTWVMNDAYGRPNGGELAPVKGTLKRLRVIAQNPGKFRLQLTKAREVHGVWQAKVKANGPLISYQGQDPNAEGDAPITVESFKVNLPIKKGWRLSMKTKSTSALRCSSGGDNTLKFIPPLALHSGFTPMTDGDGCWALLEGVIKY